MKKVTPTVARIVKKSLWKDINRWIDEGYSAQSIEIDTHNKRKLLRRTLELSKKNDGIFYAGAILVEEDRFPSSNKLIVLTWDAYIHSKRLAVIPVMYDMKLEETMRRGIALTEHAIEQMAGRLDTLDRVQIIHELAAAAMPSCFLVLNFLERPKQGDYFAVKTPHGIGIIAISHFENIDVAGVLVTWISDEEATARKYKNIEWAIFPRRQKTDAGSIFVDIPAGAKMYLPHPLTKEWAMKAINDY